MTRRMACSKTVEPVEQQIKDVTRRHVDSWKNLKPGDRLTLIEKGMGLKKGEKQRVLAEVVVVDVRVESIECIATEPDGCAREGFPHWTPAEFIRFWCESHGYAAALPPSNSLGLDLPIHVDCRRIEWEYL